MSHPTTGVHQVVQELRARCDAYRLLSACFCEPDLATFLEERVYERLVRALDTCCSEAAPAARALHEAALTSSQQSLMVEYARLFVGPGPLLAPPYGSVYLDGDGLVMGSTTQRVTAAYREAGLAVPQETPDLPDHVAAELEFLHYLSSLEADAEASGNVEVAAEMGHRRDAFLESYLRPWAPAFARRVEEHTKSGYYKHLARCLDALISLAPAAAAPRGARFPKPMIEQR